MSTASLENQHSRQLDEFWRLKAGLPLVVLMLASIAATGYASAGEAASNVCFSPDVLRGNAGDERIRTYDKRAFVAPQLGADELNSAPGPLASGGLAIRRVDLPPGVRRVALTFDLCEQPHEVAGYQGRIVDFLRDNNIKATFFSGGKWLKTHPERGSQLLGDPLFEIGTHGWEHRNLQVLQGGALNGEIDAATQAYRETYERLKARQCLDRTGGHQAFMNASPRPGLFRFPFGACSTEALAALAQRGLMAVQWDVSSGDPWPQMTSQRMARSVVNRVRPGSIVLFHANGRGHGTEGALPQIVRSLRDRGFEFVTVSELLATPGAKVVTSSTCYDSRPGDTDRYRTLAARMERVYQRFYRRYGDLTSWGGARAKPPQPPESNPLRGVEPELGHAGPGTADAPERPFDGLFPQ